MEFQLPKPSYTIDTLAYLSEKFPLERFSVVMGADSFQNIHRWKNFEQLVDRYSFIVYNRPGFDIEDTYGANITKLESTIIADIVHLHTQADQRQKIY